MSFSSVLMSFVLSTMVVSVASEVFRVERRVVSEGGSLRPLKKALIDSIIMLRLQERLVVELKVIAGVGVGVNALTETPVSTREDLCCRVLLISCGPACPAGAS